MSQERIDSVYELIKHYQDLNELNKEHALATVKTLSAVQLREESKINKEVS
ncbi:hypothetical protein [Bacillus thuringiensis]|uniref:hypothetical protein n=1 Tax=Bacillus thuringiensis TaxID=1428 RepID=UPI00148318FF|nr:hypothetical protein [Bacillus thuringiensis]